MSLMLISLGPGAPELMTHAACQALQRAQVVGGYRGYLDRIAPMLHPDQKTVSWNLGEEQARAKWALQQARQGISVALVSGGDVGISGMATPTFEQLFQEGWTGVDPEVEVYPGISAFQSVAARLGAPLGPDFCVISLSDYGRDWSKVERRLQAAAWGDLVTFLYNPRSQRRPWQLERALEIFRGHRSGETPVVWARNVTRPGECLEIYALEQFPTYQVDMFSLVLIGNSLTRRRGSSILTPRGGKTVQHVP